LSVHPVEQRRIEHCPADQLARAYLGVHDTEGPRQRSHLGRVEAPQRRDQQLLDPVARHVVGDQQLQGREQYGDRRLAHQRSLVAGHLDRDARRGQRPAQSRDRRASGAHQHRHLAPPDAVLEMRPAEQVGDVLDLRPCGVEREHLDRARPELGRRGLGIAERVVGRPRDRSAHRDPGRDRARRAQQSRAEAPGGAEREYRRRLPLTVRELAGELEDPAHVCAAEAVDRLIRIAHGDEVPAVAGKGTKQRHLTGVGVLVLVHEHAGVHRAQLGLVDSRLDHAARDQVGVVDRRPAAEDIEVLLQEQTRRLELRNSLVATELDELMGVESALAGARDHRLHLAGEAPGADRSAQRLGPPDRLGRVGEQLLQHDVLLGRGQQLQGRGVELRRRVAPDQAVGEGVERRRQVARQGPPEPRGHPVTQLFGSLAGEGQRQHRVGVDPPPLDPADDRFDHRRRLAGAGSGEHEQRPAGVVDDTPLVRVELRRRRGGTRWREPVAHGQGGSGHVTAQPTISARQIVYVGLGFEARCARTSTSGELTDCVRRPWFRGSLRSHLNQRRARSPRGRTPARPGSSRARRAGA
jgi:hypothetical protein